MESDINTTTNGNNLTNIILDCFNNSFMFEISNISCDYVFNISSPNVENRNLKLVSHKKLVLGICFIIIVANLIVVISSGLIIKTKWQHSNSFILLGNVAMADMILGLIVAIGISIPERYFSHSTCVFLLGGQVSSLLASLYSVCLIAIDRYLYIMHGMYYQQWVKRSRLRLMISGLWILSLLVGFLPAMGWSNDFMLEQNCWFIKIAPPDLLCLTALVGFIPVITACILYIIILMKALQTVDQLQESVKATMQTNNSKLRVFRGRYQTNKSSISNSISTRTLAMSKENIATDSANNIAGDNNVNITHKSWNQFKSSVHKIIRRTKPRQNTKPSDVSKWKAVKIVLFTTVSIVITWVPQITATLMYVVCDKEKMPDFCNDLEAAVASPLSILGLSNSILNPIIYAWWHSGFKRSVKIIFMKICKDREATLSIRRRTKSSFT